MAALLKDRVGADVLSAREREVAELLAAGSTNREIASAIGISAKTIDTHRAHVLKKLGVRNNAELARWAIEKGVISLNGRHFPQLVKLAEKIVGHPDLYIRLIDEATTALGGGDHAEG